MGTIYAEIGYKEVEEGKPTRYYGDQTDNGVCYKDLKAFKDNSDICYIPECELLEDWCADAEMQNLGYTREEIMDITRDCITDEGITPDEQFVEYLAECALQNVDWQSIGTYLNEVDIYETWEYFNKK